MENAGLVSIEGKTKDAVCNLSTLDMALVHGARLSHYQKHTHTHTFVSISLGHTVTCKAAVLAVVSVVTREKNRAEQDFSNNATVGLSVRPSVCVCVGVCVCEREREAEPAEPGLSLCGM